MTKDLVKKEVKMVKEDVRTLRRWDVKFVSESGVGGNTTGLSSLPTLPSLIREGVAPMLLTDIGDLHYDIFPDKNLTTYRPNVLASSIKKPAFTLAEVLITLAVIGVVAAITMPALITKYQKMQTVNKLKKVYTTLNQAMKLSEAENGDYANWESGADIGSDAYFERYWKPYLNVAKICKTYSDCGYSSNTQWLVGFNIKENTGIVVRNNRTTFILTDGTLLSIFTTMGENTTSSYIYADLNAGSKPNMQGHDVFRFYRNKRGQIYPDGYDSSNVNVYCVSNNMTHCGAKIMKDGWKIKDDYPW